MALVFKGFPAGTSVSLYRPKATPGGPLGAPIATVASDVNAITSFADQPGGNYLASGGGRQVWQFVAPGYTPAESPPFVPAGQLN